MRLSPASCRQKLLTNNKMAPLETLYFTAPVCLMWMVPAALVTEIPAALRHHSFALMRAHPLMFLASGFSGFFVNITSFLLVKRTSSMTLKTMTMARNGGSHARAQNRGLGRSHTLCTALLCSLLPAVAAPCLPQRPSALLSALCGRCSLLATCPLLYCARRSPALAPLRSLPRRAHRSSPPCG